MFRRYVLTATDLFTKFVVAKSLYTKSAAEVSRKLVNILLDFGLVQRIISDQGREFVNEVSLERGRKTVIISQSYTHTHTPTYLTAV